MLCSQTWPGPVSVARNRPSPPNRMFLKPLTIWMSKVTLGSKMPTWPACTSSRSPAARSRSTNSPERSSQTTPGPLIFCRMKPSPPKKPAPIRFCQATSKRHRFLRDQERLLAADQRLARLQLRGHDRAGKARREGDMAGAVGGEVGDEERAAAERARDAGEQAAAGMGVHRDLIVHPGHRVGLAVDRLARREIDRHRLHDVAGNLVAHRRGSSSRAAFGARADYAAGTAC